VVKATLKKTVGVILIILGVLALVTPFTPGAWLVFIGLEFLGFRLAFWSRIKAWLKRRKETEKDSIENKENEL